jgi:hypothetical protein
MDTETLRDEGVCVLCAEPVSPQTKAMLVTYRPLFDAGVAFPCHVKCLEKVASPRYGLTAPKELRG